MVSFEKELKLVLERLLIFITFFEWFLLEKLAKIGKFGICFTETVGDAFIYLTITCI